jgi:predicted amidohydrolase
LNSRENAIDVSQQIKKIQEKCKENSIWCIFGSYIPKNDKIMNAIFLVDGSGKIKYEYHKVHLWIAEKEKVTAGKTNKVIDTEFGKIGIIDCWDFAFPSFVQQLSRKGAKIIFCPSYLVDSEEDAEPTKAIPLVRAFENLAFYVSCDAFTDETLSESYICHPLRVLQKIEKKEGIIFADLNLDEIDSLRKHYDHLD